MTSYNIPNPKGFIVFVLFIATLMWVSFIMSGCKNKQVQCEAYSKAQNKIADSLVFNVADFKKEDTVYDDSWQGEDWFEDDRLAQIDDTTFYILLDNGDWVLIDSLGSYYE